MWLKNPRDPSDIVENMAFTGYAAHTQELDDIVDDIVRQVQNGVIFGETNLTFNFDDSMSDSDLEYIKREVERRCQS